MRHLCRRGDVRLTVEGAHGSTRLFPAKPWSAQVRFAKHVFPGETLLVEMWAVSPSKVVFQTRVKERDAVAISNAAVEFRPGRMRQPAHEAAGSLSKL